MRNATTMKNLIKISILLLSITLLNCKSDDDRTTPEDLVIGSFEFDNNANFQLIEQDGIDSYVGYLQSSDIKVNFDLGWYTSAIENPSADKFDVFTDNVDGHYVQILKAKNPTADVTRIHIYKIQDSIDSPFGYDSLTMYADNLTADQQSVVIDLYNSWNSTD